MYEDWNFYVDLHELEANMCTAYTKRKPLCLIPQWFFLHI